VDPRVKRTRKRIQDALFELAHEREFEQIAVSDIAERAGINRSTFYQHYADKETVLADALDAVAAEAGAALDTELVLADGPPEVLRNFMAHIEANADIYRQVFSGAGSGVALARLQSHVIGAIDGVARATQLGHPLPAPVEVVAAGVAGSMVGVIGAWLEMEPLPSSAEAARWAWEIMIGPPTAEGTACL